MLFDHAFFENIVNVKTNFVLSFYAALGACREAADFLSRPFASAEGGYSKRQIYLSFTIAAISMLLCPKVFPCHGNI
jgi:hypothetical protein